MNALATKPKAAAEPAPVLPEDIRSRLMESRARHGTLTARQMQLAEKSVQSPAVEREYFEVVDQLSAAAADVERYELAIAALDARARQQLEDAQAAEIRGLQGRVADMLERRLAAAHEFEQSITSAVAAMRQIAALGKAAWEAWPGQQPTAGVAFGGEELTILIAAELARLGTVPVPTGGAFASAEMSLPAPRAPGLMTAGQPDMIEPLTVALQRANDYGKLALGGG